MAAVQKIDSQPNGQPRKESQPGENWQARHQKHAKQHTQNRRSNPAGRAKATMAARIAVAQNNHSNRNQGKGEEGADVRKIGECADIENSGRNANHKTGNPSGGRGRAEPGMDASKKLREEPVPRHGEPYPGLSELKDQQRRNHSHHGAEQYAELNPAQRVRTGAGYQHLQTVGDRSGIVEHGVPRDNTGKNDGDGDIKKSADN